MTCFFLLVLPPTKKPTLRTLFGEIMGTVPVEVLPIVEMCREKAMYLFDVYDATIDDKEKDMIGVGMLKRRGGREEVAH